MDNMHTGMDQEHSHTHHDHQHENNHHVHHHTEHTTIPEHVHDQHVHLEMDTHDKSMMHDHKMMEGNHNMDGMHMGHMNMQMTFTTKTYSDFLLEGLYISSIQGIILAMVFTIVISILIDILKIALHMRESRRIAKMAHLTNINQIISTVYHIASLTLSYILMLCVMSMNIWLMVSVVLGSGIAHLVLRPIFLGKWQEQITDTHCNTAENEPLNDFPSEIESSLRPNDTLRNERETPILSESCDT